MIDMNYIDIEKTFMAAKVMKQDMGNMWNSFLHPSMKNKKNKKNKTSLRRL
jgi:hypothetical protein